MNSESMPRKIGNTDIINDWPISVVIPTVGRPELQRAVNSALVQTLQPIEVIVVADTIDPINIDNDPRVRLVRVGPAAGGNAARQLGIELASGDFVALLDDDDEWLGNHLQNLTNAVAPENKATLTWIAASKLFAKFGTGREEVWPRRLKKVNETLPEYIFRKHRLKGGVGFIQASTLLFPRQLALQIPFDKTLKYHQDISWLVDLANATDDISVFQSEIPTAIYHVGTSSVSKKISVVQSQEWAKSHLDLSDRRTFGDFILVQSIQGAKNAGSIKEVISTIFLAFRSGRPGIWASLYATGIGIFAVVSRINAFCHSVEKWKLSWGTKKSG